jgi:hypothetical protein
MGRGRNAREGTKSHSTLLKSITLLCNPGQAAAILSGRPQFNLKVEARCLQCRLVKRGGAAKQGDDFLLAASGLKPMRP